jgi:hypothetical protein
MDEITAQVIVFFTGGFETTSATMSFCLYELAKNKDVQDRLRSEMDSVLSQHGGKVTYEAVNEMKYLDRVVSGKTHIFISKDVGKRNFGIMGGGVQLDPLATAATNGLLCQPRVIMMMEKLVE